jgi:hypothetical protein
MILEAANYLHHGDVLEVWQCAGLAQYSGMQAKRTLIADLRKQSRASKFLVDLISGYGAKHARKIHVDTLRKDIANSLRLREYFKRIGCRGFSFKAYDTLKLVGPLRPSVNLQITLMPEESLFYPPRVKRYLRRVNSNHYFYNGFPSIAFALGRRIGGVCCLMVLQSDLSFRAPSYIRDYFRGWRKVLFAVIVRAVLKDTRLIYLPRTEDVLRCCHKGFRAPQSVPESWKCIYDATAETFGMELIRLGKKVNIQVFSDQRGVYTDYFYALDLSAKIRKEFSG